MLPSAPLEVESANRGFLPPRVAMTSITDAVTTPAPAEGLLVYNNGSGALQEKGYYYWNGTQWTAISGFSSSSGGDMRVGETRATVIGVNYNEFQGNSTSVNRTFMTGTEAENTTVQDRKLLIDAAPVGTSFVSFEGMRMDVAAWLIAFNGANVYSPKLVNESGSTKYLAITSLSTFNTLAEPARQILPDNAVNYLVDGYDGLSVRKNAYMEYVNVNICVSDVSTGAIRLYIATWSVSWIDDDHGRDRIVCGFTVTRHAY